MKNETEIPSFIPLSGSVQVEYISVCAMFRKYLVPIDASYAPILSSDLAEITDPPKIVATTTGRAVIQARRYRREVMIKYSFPLMLKFFLGCPHSYESSRWIGTLDTVIIYYPIKSFL